MPKKVNAYAWLVAHVNYTGENCLIWPFAKSDGRGNLGHKGKVLKAHRVMCELVNGAPPSRHHDAAHSCGRGHDACVHPKHLSWKTKSENQLDRARHGTKSNGCVAKLSPEQIQYIRDLKGKVPQADVAAAFRITRGYVSAIQNNRERVLSPLSTDQRIT